MPRPTPPGGPRINVQARLLASEVAALMDIADQQGYDTMSDTVRFLLSEADDRFSAPEREETK